MIITNHSFMTCGGSEALASTIIFKTCGVKTDFGWHECCILNVYLEHPCSSGCVKIEIIRRSMSLSLIKIQLVLILETDK